MGLYPTDYDAVLARAETGGPGQLGDLLAQELPPLWARSYQQMTPHPTNVLRMEDGGFEYLFDFSSELVAHGEVSLEESVEDRLVAVHGWSQPPTEKRDATFLRGMPIGAARHIAPSGRDGYDRGHFIAHSLGGRLDINIFPQPSAVNRGWSDPGKLFRSMERYCQKHPGTYCFNRPIYVGKSVHPALLEFGVLKADGKLWVNTFPNTVHPEEMQVIEKLVEEKTAEPGP